MTGIYITIMILALKLIWDWQRIRNLNKREVSRPIPTNTDSDPSVHFLDLFPTENIPLYSSFYKKRESFDEYPKEIPLSQRKIDIEKLDELLLKYPFQKEVDIIEKYHCKTYKYTSNTTQLCVDYEHDLMEYMYLKFIKVETEPWIVDALHDIGKTWNLVASMDVRECDFIDLNDYEQIKRYFDEVLLKE